MILAIDGYEANVAQRVGIGRYAFEILRHLHAILTRQNQGTTVRVYVPEDPRFDMPKETAWWQYRVGRPRKFWTLVALPLALSVDTPRANVVFSPTHYIPRFIGIPRVMAIMDMSFLHFPELFRTRDRHQLTQWTKFSAMHAARIITISSFSKDAIMKAYWLRENRVVVIYPGMTMKPKVESQPRLDRGQTSNVAVLQKHDIKGDYVLSVGTIQPRKNYVRLIEAFSRLDKNLTLVIVGKKGWLYEEILTAPQKLGIADRVRFLDFVPDEDLPALYSLAQCFALPSLYEGFGLPVLEAMSEGCPVVVSDVSSLPEIAGEAGIYVKPESVESILQGLSTALSERDTPKGKKRIADGIVQAQKFTWEKAAKQTLAVLEQVGKEKI